MLGLRSGESLWTIQGCQAQAWPWVIAGAPRHKAPPSLGVHVDGEVLGPPSWEAWASEDHVVAALALTGLSLELGSRVAPGC